MLSNYIFMIPMKSKTTDKVINAHLKDVYYTFKGSKYTLSDRRGEIIFLFLYLLNLYSTC